MWWPRFDGGWEATSPVEAWEEALDARPFKEEFGPTCWKIVAGVIN